MFGPYLIDTVVLTKHAGSDIHGEPLATTTENVKAFIDYGERTMQNESGEIITSMAKVIMRPRTIIVGGFSTRATNTISYMDTITFDGMAHKIVKMGKARDFAVRGIIAYVA